MSIASERLKKVRIDSGLSQKEMADKLFIPLRTYQSYERGERDLSTAVVLAICLTFNISSDYLIGHTTISEHTEPQERLAELAESGDPSPQVRMLMGLPEKEKSPPVGTKELFEEMFSEFTDNEIDDLMKYARFLIYLRSHSED